MRVKLITTFSHKLLVGNSGQKFVCIRYAFNLPTLSLPCHVRVVFASEGWIVYISATDRHIENGITICKHFVKGCFSHFKVKGSVRKQQCYCCKHTHFRHEFINGRVTLYYRGP